MPYLIDGHNLIPKVPGFSLSAADDEIHLIELLQEFCRLQRKNVEVYFDKAPAGHQGARHFGMVTAFFVRQDSSADSAIRQRLSRLGKAAANWTLVSSDEAVQAAGRFARAQVLSSEAFVLLLRKTLKRKSGSGFDSSSAQLSPDEVDEWLKLFGGS
jgi:uncharacterized protein